MLSTSFISKLFAILTVVIFFNCTSFSQSFSYLDSLDGKFALQFQINENFSLSDFQGTILSGKYHFSNRDAIRLGLTIEYGDNEGETDLTRLDTTYNQSSNAEANKFDITINTQYIRYITVAENISLFGGGGPFINFFDINSENKRDENGNKEERNYKINGYGIGLDAILGIEWWFYKYMSLSAGYGISFSYRYSKDTIKDDIVEGEATFKSFYVAGNNINFGITVYF